MKKTALVIDSKGNRWVWSCGWRIVDKKGEPLATRVKCAKVFNGLSKQRFDSRQQPMGHLEFRKCVKILDTRDKKQREVLHAMDRPGRNWRRMIDREVWSHELFGTCWLLASDGCHAIIETLEGEHEKVCFENLNELAGVPIPPRFGSEKKERKATAGAATKTQGLLDKYLNLHKKKQTDTDSKIESY